MKHLFRAAAAFAAVAVLTLLVSCVSGPEAAGDKAYDMAKKTTGDVRRTQLKTAYMNYRAAVMANPDKVSTKLRNRFIEMALVRAQVVLTEGGATMEAVPLLMEDIEGQLKDDASSDLRQQFAAFIAQIGDSSTARQEYIDALSYYDKAIEKAVDAAPFREKRASVIKNVAEENFELGMMELELGQKEKNEENFIRAEYYANVALFYDSTFDKALKLLSDVRKLNVATYAAFLSVVDPGVEKTPVFRKVNKFDILLAVPAIRTAGGATTAIVHMYSNTYNPLRMRSEHFSFITADGKKFTAAQGQQMQPDILDQEREGQYTLRFPAVPGNIKKLIYDNPPHYSEKVFF